jgi:hypothetical protein
MKPHLVFFFPEMDKIGGVQILFYRLIKQFILKGDFGIVVVDFIDGFLHKRLIDFEYTFIPVKSQCKINLQKNHILFTTPVKINSLNEFFEFSPESSLFLWEFGPFSFIQNHLFTNTYRKKGIERASKISDLLEHRRKKMMAGFLRDGTKLNGIFFMCGKNFHYNRIFYKIRFQPNYIPIPVILGLNLDPAAEKNKLKRDRVNIFWMSRLENKKYSPFTG